MDTFPITLALGCLLGCCLAGCTSGPDTQPDFTNSLGMGFARVPIVSREQPRRQQENQILVAKYETQQKQMSLFRQEMRLPPQSQSSGGRAPAAFVSWEEAVAFCDWLTQKERASGRIRSDQRYRLPTDHEWSCAAGIGHLESASELPETKCDRIRGVYPWGNTWPPPRKRSANSSGLHDLSGSLWEWCEDRFRPGKDWRVLRGGSWKSVRPVTHLSSHRTHDPEGYRSDSVGFRCVLVTEAGSQAKP